MKGTAHPVNRFALFAVFCGQQIPPVADSEQIGHFVHTVEIRRPKIPLEFPMLQILRGIPDCAAGAYLFPLQLARPQYHDVFFAALIP